MRTCVRRDVAVLKWTAPGLTRSTTCDQKLALAERAVLRFSLCDAQRQVLLSEALA